MSGFRPRHASGAFLACLVLLAVAGAAAAAGYAGRPIAEVLAELRGPGLDFIYSSELLPPGLTVAEEPTSANRLVIAREILAARGLSEEDLIVDVTVLPAAELGKLMETQDVVLSF